MENPNNPFITSVTIKTIESFMQTVGYQGVVDKVSAFYTKYLAQPWKTMFKVFNRCLTTRTFWHDQTKINILQLFHVVVDRTNVDYAALLWWDFMNNVFQKKNVIQYPRFIKLIIADLMEKYPSIPRRHDEDYHSIKDDTPLEYETVFVGVDVPMNQPQPVVSSQGTHRNTPRVIATSPQGKKRKQRAEETSSPRKPLKVTIRQKKQSTPSIPPLEKLDEEEIKRMVKGGEDEESYASEFADSMLNDDVDDSGTRIEPGSHKEHLKKVNNDDEVIEKENKNDEIEKEKKDNDVEKMDEIEKEEER
ncbi:hypothetical protein Tco_1221688 [Tanacetum coccineum]